jgi:hypothetical protein
MTMRGRLLGALISAPYNWYLTYLPDSSTVSRSLVAVIQNLKAPLLHSGLEDKARATYHGLLWAERDERRTLEGMVITSAAEGLFLTEPEKYRRRQHH